MQVILSYGQWTSEWWQWFLEKREQPSDRYVVFVSGRWMQPNNKNLFETNTEIIQNKAILFPVDNWISLGLPFASDDDLIQVARERMDRLSEMHSDISPIRIMSLLFELSIKEKITNPELRKVIQKGKYKAVSDGYWIFLKPNTFSKGMHTIETFGSCASGRLSLEAHHHFNVS